MKKKDFNIIISGVGGQGIITLLKILAQSALIENYEVRTSELHGLSQRGGSVCAHIRFGKNIFSPLISKEKADLVLALEKSESLRSIEFASRETNFVINNKFIPFFKGPSQRSVVEKIKRLPGYIYSVSASEICQLQFKKEVLAGIYLLSFACIENLLPLQPKSILKAIDNTIPKKYLSINKKTFELAQKNVS